MLKYNSPQIQENISARHHRHHHLHHPLNLMVIVMHRRKDLDVTPHRQDVEREDLHLAKDGDQEIVAIDNSIPLAFLGQLAYAHFSLYFLLIAYIALNSWCVVP